MTKKLTVRYIEGVPGISHSNIVWDGEFKARGRFPSNHPCAPGSLVFDVTKHGDAFGSDQFGTSPTLEAFRRLGYWASCFPEGDGITMKEPPGKTRADVVRDIEATFGWVVRKDRKGKRHG